MTYSSNKKLIRASLNPSNNQISMGLVSKNPSRLKVVANFTGYKMTMLLLVVA